MKHATPITLFVLMHSCMVIRVVYSVCVCIECHFLYQRVSRLYVGMVPTCPLGPNAAVISWFKHAHTHALPQFKNAHNYAQRGRPGNRGYACSAYERRKGWCSCLYKVSVCTMKTSGTKCKNNFSYEIVKHVGMEVPKKYRRIYAAKQRMVACNNNSMHNPIKYKM